jgi:hypothetical protein
MSRHELRRRVALFNAHLYEDIETMGLGPYQYAVYDLGSSHLRMNLVRAVADTYVSKITQSKPKPRALTSDGNWTLKKRAEGLSRWFEGKADDLDLYRSVSTPGCRDSAVFGMGLAKVYRQWPEEESLWDVGVERTFPWELVADDAEAQQPNRLRNLAHIKWYDRQIAAEMFPGSAEYLLRFASKQAPVVTSFDLATNSTADLIAVSELWHLPSHPEAKDGRHVICVDGKTLYDGPWKRMRFPFARLYRSAPTMGIWGVSIPHELRGMQAHINQTLVDIEDCLRLYGKPRWIAQAGSVEKSAIDDDIDSIVEYQGNAAPTLYSPSVMPAEQYAFLWQVWQKGFEQIGINQQAGQAQLPEGLSGSGASLRAWDDLQSGRMYEASSNFEDWHMQIADLMIDEAREIAEKNTSYASAYRGKTYVEVVRFRDVDPGADKYWLKVWPESRLSKAPAQRLAQLQELFNAKIIGPEEFRELLEFPDLEAEDSLMNAPRELAEKLRERFLEAKRPSDPDVLVYPEPEWPLDQLKVRMQYALVRAELDDVPDGNLDLFRRFIALCDLAAAKGNGQMGPAPSLVAPGGALTPYAPTPPPGAGGGGPPPTGAPPMPAAA